MDNLVYGTVKAVVSEHPEIVRHLTGLARWAGNIYSIKLGEAPDDWQRRRDERKLERDAAAFLDSQRKRILKRVKAQYKNLPPDFWTEEGRMLWGALQDDFVGILVHGMQGGINLLTNDIGNFVDIPQVQQRLISYAGQYRDTWLTYINETTREFVEKAITNWVASGDPFDALIKTLSDPNLHIFSRARAKIVAMTETTRLNALANQETWRSTGYINEFRWNTANDERVCPICGPNHRKTFPLSELANLIPAHVYCRCWSTPVVNLDAADELMRQRLGL